MILSRRKLLPTTKTKTLPACDRASALTQAYNWLVKNVLKSLLAAIVGTGIFFFFFMALSIPVLAAVARLRSVPLDSTSVVVDPSRWFRMVGLPLSAVAFVVSFGLGMRKFRGSEHGTSSPPSHRDHRVS